LQAPRYPHQCRHTSPRRHGSRRRRRVCPVQLTPREGHTCDVESATREGATEKGKQKHSNTPHRNRHTHTRTKRAREEEREEERDRERERADAWNHEQRLISTRPSLACMVHGPFLCRFLRYMQCLSSLAIGRSRKCTFAKSGVEHALGCVCFTCLCHQSPFFFSFHFSPLCLTQHSFFILISSSLSTMPLALLACSAWCAMQIMLTDNRGRIAPQQITMSSPCSALCTGCIYTYGRQGHAWAYAWGCKADCFDVTRRSPLV
ncbi:unnamed protein product, partial [Chondrus crispus]